MRRTTQKILASTLGKEPQAGNSRRPSMSSAPPALEEQILTILQEAEGEPVTIPQIEEKLEERLASQFPIDTFDVRDAVWRLVAQQRAQFTPRRYVKAADE
jgi:hypothetical protein